MLIWLLVYVHWDLIFDMANFRLGFMINPLAGTGGPLANKGSDNLQLSEYVENPQSLNAYKRGKHFLSGIFGCHQSIEIFTVTGLMGEDCAREVGFSPQLIDYQPTALTTSIDTKVAIAQLIAAHIDILVFVGGDGTARDVCDVVNAENPSQLVLGVPAGVKMHSAVYAVNPRAAAELINLLIHRELLNVQAAEVRDIDEAAFRLGQVKSRHFGAMQTPFDGRFVQQVKQGGFEIEELVLMDITAHIQQLWDDETLIIFGPGSTLLAIQQQLGLPVTLLGFDIVKAGTPLILDANAQQMANIVSSHAGKVLVFITAIGGQGHIIGRGNQQLSADLLRQLGKAAVQVVATKTKLASLHGRSLLMDSGDPGLDEAWQGFMPVICGYHDVVLYPLGHDSIHDLIDESATNNN